MARGEGLAGVTDEPIGELCIRARVMANVSAMKIRKRHCFRCLGLVAD